MSVALEQENGDIGGGLTIHISANPYSDDINAIEVICTMDCAHSLIRELRFREVREG
jgi:hypothetical protein